MQNVTAGRLVAYVEPQPLSGDLPAEDRTRPLLVIHVWPDGAVSGIEFHDADRDNVMWRSHEPVLLEWRARVNYDEAQAPGTWSWPARVAGTPI